jgi:hypothetical protein
MPGKHIGLSGQCWHDRLIGELPNIYIYSVNNPSEGYRKATFLRGIDFISPAPNRERWTLQGPQHTQGSGNELQGSERRAGARTIV